MFQKIFDTLNSLTGILAVGFLIIFFLAYYLKHRYPKAWDVLNSNFTILAFGFLLTTFVGSFLNDRYQQATWDREKKFQILLLELNDGKIFVEKLSDLVNKRLFDLQRVMWTIETYQNPDRINGTWEQYYRSVIEWNQKLDANYGRIEQLYGTEMTDFFMLRAEDNKRPKSLHGHFRNVHIEILTLLKDCLSKEGCKDRDRRVRQAYVNLRTLNSLIDNFLRKLSSLSFERMRLLERL